MNKTININLAGIIFHLDDDAFKLLDAYLNKLKTVFQNTDGSEEIIADIEARFAELFQLELVDASAVVSIALVQKTIEVVGEPEMFASEEDDDDTPHSSTENNQYTYTGRKHKRKLYRNAEEASVGGVCAGLAAYLGTETWIIRAIFVIMVLFGIGSGLLIYIVLWIVVPEAKTTAQKLEMKGEPVTASNISKSVQEQFENLKNTVKNGAQKNNIGDFLEKLGALILSVLSIFFKVMLKIIGVLMLLAGIFVLIAILGSFFGMGNLFFDWLSTDSSENVTLQNLSDVFLVSENQATWILISGILFVMIPLFQIIYAGLRILFNIDKLNNKIHWSLTVVWILAIFTLVGNAVQIGVSFDNNATTEHKTLVQTTSDTLTVKIHNLDDWARYGDDDFNLGDVESQIANVDFDIARSQDSLMHLIVIKRARGWNRKEAKQRAEVIHYNFKVENNTLTLDDYLSFKNTDKFRAQEVDLILQVPQGKTVYLDRGTEGIIDDISNLQNMYDGNMPTHHWEMTRDGLSCTDCYIP